MFPAHGVGSWGRFMGVGFIIDLKKRDGPRLVAVHLFTTRSVEVWFPGATRIALPCLPPTHTEIAFVLPAHVCALELSVPAANFFHTCVCVYAGGCR